MCRLTIDGASLKYVFWETFVQKEKGNNANYVSETIMFWSMKNNHHLYYTLLTSLLQISCHFNQQTPGFCSEKKILTSNNLS